MFQYVELTKSMVFFVTCHDGANDWPLLKPKVVAGSAAFEKSPSVKSPVPPESFGQFVAGFTRAKDCAGDAAAGPLGPKFAAQPAIETAMSSAG